MIRPDRHGLGLWTIRRFAGFAFRFDDLFGIPDFFFHDLTRLERDDVLGLDVDGVARSRISRFPGLASFDLKDSEVPKFNTTVAHQGVDDGVERELDDFFRLDLRELQLIRNELNNFFFGHSVIPEWVGPSEAGFDAKSR